ncbi:MAG: hypothetical protein ACFB00_07760 [Parvularculaceae bacterium]
MTKLKLLALAMIGLFSAGSLSGCVIAAAAGAGALAADEISETDGKFDPLERVRGKDDGDN